MKIVQLNPGERKMIVGESAIGVNLTRAFLGNVIKWSSSRYEVTKKKDVIDTIYKGMNQGYVKRDNRIILQEKWFSGSYCQCSSMTRKGEYLADYSNRLLVECHFSGHDDEIKEVFSIYKFNVVKPASKLYEQEVEILEHEDDPRGYYQIRSIKK